MKALAELREASGAGFIELAEHLLQG